VSNTISREYGAVQHRGCDVTENASRQRAGTAGVVQVPPSREFDAGGYNGSAERDPLTGQQPLTSFPYHSYQRMQLVVADHGALATRGHPRTGSSATGERFPTIGR